jgi:hypothetical protein
MYLDMCLVACSNLRGMDSLLENDQSWPRDGLIPRLENYLLFHLGKACGVACTLKFIHGRDTE